MPNQQSLKGRLWLLGIVSALSVAIVAISAIWFTFSSEKLLHDFIDERIAVRHSAVTAYANGLQKGQALRNILLDPANKKGYDNFAKADEVFRSESDKLVQLLQASGDKPKADKMKSDIDAWLPLQAQVIDLVKAGSREEAQALLVGKETPAWRMVRDNLLEQVKSSEEAAAKDRVELLDGLSRSRTFAIVLSAISLLVVAVITVLVGRGIFHQVGGEPSYAAGLLQRFAQGDLSERPHVQPGDQTSILAAMQVMQSQIHDLIAQAAKSAETVVSESEAMRSDAARLAQTAEEQSSATTAIAAAVEELTVSIGSMSQSANEAGDLSQESETQAHESLQVVGQATDIIQQVASGMSEAATTMEELSAKVGNITGIVQTIREIADQTNLLALNAAIEAARAGEQGRGFAVVADEVRKLAELTTKSTEQISSIVTGIRQSTDDAFAMMSRAKERALDGAGRTAEVRDAVVKMDESAIRVGQAIETIAEALREQTAASTDIAQRIELIAQGTDLTHAASTESSRRSNLLVGLSQSLKDNVRRFRI
ncbi:methyl-accepting chemotaxis protein [Azonexus sp. IMCC34839]|uniref:methyl-accepting chemotaxis protein n=1 Tax=Azonexus sp. IMCC34839 TaxID=3133695 RepID=UPI00399A5753